MTYRLTPHQSDVLRTVHAFYGRLRRPVPVSMIGCSGALKHLEEKGRVRLTEGTPGPRGGIRLFVEPTAR